MKSHRLSRGFTLLELLVVLLIIALLAGYVGPKLFGEVGKAKTKTAASQMKSIADALDHYRLDTGHYPSTEQGINVLTKKPSDEPKWQGPYLMKDVPADPWDRPYVYNKPGENGRDY
ncbi:MAG: type II secretion system major pseudopilin GspG, partial [Burkholderiales bacterium]|nr:type II secretion system major pseudopilin GspG [Burkholderiales bacterium]